MAAFSFILNNEYEFTQEQAYLDTNYRASLDNTFTQIGNVILQQKNGQQRIAILVNVVAGIILAFILSEGN